MHRDVVAAAVVDVVAEAAETAVAEIGDDGEGFGEIQSLEEEEVLRVDFARPRPWQPDARTSVGQHCGERWTRCR